MFGCLDLSVFHLSIGVQNWSATYSGCSGDHYSELCFVMRPALNFCRDVKAAIDECSSKTNQGPLPFLSLLYMSPLLTTLSVLPSSPILCSQLVYKKQTSFVFLRPWTELTGSAAFSVLPQCGFEGTHSLKNCFHIFFLDHGLIAAMRFWLDLI